MIFVFIVDYQTRKYSVSTGSYIQVKLLGELGGFCHKLHSAHISTIS